MHSLAYKRTVGGAASAASIIPLLLILFLPPSQETSFSFLAMQIRIDTRGLHCPASCAGERGTGSGGVHLWQTVAGLLPY